MTQAEKNILALFHDAASRVPAYKVFLKRNKVKPKSIQTTEDFRRLPIIDKKNYLSQFSLKELSWDGDLFNSRIISVSSGSTGQPFFWPRGKDQDEEGAWMHERIYKNIFDVKKYDTLVIVCFSMGTWIAGSFTTTSTINVADKGFNINVATPGLEKEEAIKVVKQVGSLYQQIIIAGYPPFVKDILDEGTNQGVKWKQYRIRFMWAGEAFSEEWRDYVLDKVKVSNALFGAINIYGTADAAMIGHETPVSILLRRIYNKNESAKLQIFKNNILPSIVQYYPEKRYIESVNGEIIFTVRAGLPLIRYNIHDNGGVLNYDELVNPVRDEYNKAVKKNHIDVKDWELPFVYLNGRKDFTVTIYAVNIYPENIKAALVDPKMRSWVTGKFTMATKYQSDMDQYFEINIELSKGLSPDDSYQKIAQTTIIDTLSKLNAEYHKLRASIGKRADPRINLIVHGDADYFTNGVKHRWVEKGK